MNFDDNALIHDRKCFDRDTLAKRLEKLKFNSLARMELFLWDLEIFLQIQAVLKDKIVLKGGAAAQFYLPIEYQRTSVDIDMIFAAGIEEVERALAAIDRKFNGMGGLFKARPHKPKDPKAICPTPITGWPFFTGWRVSLRPVKTFWKRCLSGYRNRHYQENMRGYTRKPKTSTVS